jgi:hypothetical protein
MTKFSDLSTEVVTMIVREVYLQCSPVLRRRPNAHTMQICDAAEPIWTLKRLALMDHRMNEICRGFMFRNVTIGPVDAPSERSLDFLNFLLSHSKIRLNILSVRLSLCGIKYNHGTPNHDFLNHLSILLPTLHRLKSLL